MPLPDHYIGTITVDAGPGGPPVTAALDLTVRSGPFVPTVLIFLGLVIGWVVRYMRSTGNAVASLVDRLVAIKAAAKRIPLGDPATDAARGRIDLGIDQLRALVNQGKSATAAAVADGLETCLFLLGELVGLKAKVAGTEGAGAAAVRRKVDEGLGAIAALDGTTPKFDPVWAALTAAVTAASTIGVPRPPALRQLMDENEADGQFDQASLLELLPANRTVRLPSPAAPLSGIERFAGWTAGLTSGSRWTWLVWFGRWPLKVLVGIVLFLAGLNLLYVLPTAEYVSGLFPQAMALVLWGFGSTFVTDFLKAS